MPSFKSSRQRLASADVEVRGLPLIPDAEVSWRVLTREDLDPQAVQYTDGGFFQGAAAAIVKNGTVLKIVGESGQDLIGDRYCPFAHYRESYPFPMPSTFAVRALKRPAGSADETYSSLATSSEGSAAKGESSSSEASASSVLA